MCVMQISSTQFNSIHCNFPHIAARAMSTNALSIVFSSFLGEANFSPTEEGYKHNMNDEYFINIE